MKSFLAMDAGSTWQAGWMARLYVLALIFASALSMAGGTKVSDAALFAVMATGLGGGFAIAQSERPKAAQVGLVWMLAGFAVSVVLATVKSWAYEG